MKRMKAYTTRYYQQLGANALVWLRWAYCVLTFRWDEC